MISIIIPSYNQQAYLPDAVDSVLQQTSIDWELVIVDDKSSDHSLEIANHYAEEHPKISIVEHKENKGLATSRNTGVAKAIGEYCLFLDADDMLMPNAIERIEEEIKKGHEIIAPSLKEFGISNYSVRLLEDPKLEDFRLGNRVGYCQAIKTSLLKEVGGYDPRMIWGYEDLHLTIKLLTYGAKIKTIPEILWLYRTKEQSMITTAKQHHRELLDIINSDFPEAKLDFDA